MGDLYGGRRQTRLEHLMMATQRIRITAERFLVEQEAERDAVLRGRLANGETLRAVGQLAGIALGSECELVGRYEYHEVYGRQFHVYSFTNVIPTSVIGMERFIASGYFKGIGSQTAKRLVNHFGLRTLDVLRESPAEIFQVPGLTKKRAERLVAAFSEHQDLARLATFLRGHNLPLHLAKKLALAYGGGSAALRALQNSPYQAVEDVRGIGFKTADGIAQAMGTPSTAPERMIAALLYTLTQAEEEGHMFLPFLEWTARAEALIQVKANELAVIAARMAGRNSVIFENFVTQDIAVYSARMQRIEATIAQRMWELTQGSSFAGTETVLTGAFRDLPGGDLSPAQLRAALAIFQAPLVVLTGGPGTGKTTTVCQVVKIAEESGMRVTLAAPTGRAAKRLAQSTGRPALTLHRLLEVGQLQGGHFGFLRGREQRLDGELFIVDEASMIDAPLFSHLLDALPQGARLLLVGDPEQLPAVGPGLVLHDVIASGLAVVHELELVFRQAEKSTIVQAAHAVRSGCIPSHDRGAENTDYYFLQEEDPQKASSLIVELATERLPRYLQVDAKLGVQVICPMRKGVCGMDRLNLLLSERLAVHSASSLTVGQRIFYLHDKVMNVKNDYERDIYNGDSGLISQIGEDELTVCFKTEGDTREVVFTRSETGSLVHAYAISVHKSQGSEYPCVILPLQREHTVMLYRQLLYTAMTRAKTLLVIVGSKGAYEMAIKRADAIRRYSGLVQRLAREGEGRSNG